MATQHRLPPPPRPYEYGEFRAIIEPPIRDMVPFPGKEGVDEWEPFHSEGGKDPLPLELVSLAEKTSLADQRVKKLLDGKRFTRIGASWPDVRGKEESGSLLFVFFNYDDGLAIDVTLEPNGMAVRDVAAKRYQPAPTAKEVEEVIALAREERRLSKLLTDDMEGMVLLISPSDPADPLYGHRLFDVRFGYADERLPRYWTHIDLSSKRVLKVGRTDRQPMPGGNQ